MTKRVVDALSRKGDDKEDKGEVDKELKIVGRPYRQDFEDVLRELEEDEVLGKIREEIGKDPDAHPAYTMEHGGLHHKGRLVLSAKSAWILKLLAEFHSTSTGHLGVYCTSRRISQSLF